MKTRTRPSPLVVAALLAAMSSVSSAQSTISWTSTSPDGNSGNWSDPTKWIGADVPDTSAEDASFGVYANARVVAVDGTVYTINKLSILPRTAAAAATNFTLDTVGGGALAIGAGGVEIGGGNVVAVNTPIEVTANQTWNALDNPAGGATFSGVISGSGKITRSSTGGVRSVFRFNGDNTFSGGYEQLAGNAPTTILGTSSFISGDALSSGPLGVGTITLRGGTVRSNDGTARTLQNNIVVAGNVTFGNSAQAGALTFSDVGLAVPSTFTLGSTADGAVNVVRSGGTALTIDQVIAESGGIGQGVLFSSTAGIPTVTLNRTKTATGSILVGGVNLVFANGAANSGALLAVGGSINATGSNLFSSGVLVADGTSLVATDATNFSAIAGGRATIYNHGRISFATDQTQTTVASLMSPDSQIRLALGSGSGGGTVTENYDQSALGNGRAGLVSASTGVTNYTGTLTAGSDNIYRIGGGVGTLDLGSALTGANALRIEGGGIVTTSVGHTYTGSTTIAGLSGFTGTNSLTSGLLTLSGADGALSGTSGITLNSGGILNLEIGGTGDNRVNDVASVTLNSGYLLFNNAASNGTFSETLGDFLVNAGANQINFRTTPASSTIRTVQLGTLTRSNNAVLVVRGDALGGTATARNEIKFTESPAVVGGGGALGTVNQSIVPWMRGVFDGGIGSGPGRFATYDTNGLRTLSPVTEMVQANAGSQINTAIGSSTDRNVRWNPAASGNANLLSAAGTTVTVNSLWIGNSGASSGVTYSLNGGTITVASGAVHLQHDAFQNLTVNGGTLAFGANEAVITTNSNNGFFTSIGGTLTGSGGLSVYALNAGGVQLGGTNNITGTVTLGGNGFIAVDQDIRFGPGSNPIVHAGGQLRFFAGFTTNRALTLLGDVGDNTLANNNIFTHTWNGPISGAGRLRLINNASPASNVGYVLGGENTYTGGTLVEGISVVANTNTAFGTGTLTLQGGSNGAASITLAAPAPVLGGLRGTDGTITVNPATETSTVTIGANNETGLFNGVITQAAGKTASIIKTGTGTLLFGAVQGYTGNTTINGGTLALVGSGSLGASKVTLAAPGILDLSKLTPGGIALAGGLEGSGTVNASGKTLTVGGSYAPLALAVAGNLAFDSAAQTTFVASTTAVLRSTTTVTGSVANGGSLVIAPDDGLNFAAGQSFPFVSATGGITAGYSSVNVNGNDLTPSGGGVWSASGEGLTFTYTESTATLAVASAGSASPIEQWRIDNFGNSANTGLQADTADFDGDGIPNLLEYATGTNPTVANASAVQAGVSSGRLSLTFTRINDPALTYTVEARNDLTTGNWETVSAPNNPTVGGPASTVTVVDSVTIASQPRRFLRLSVTLVP